MSHWPGSRQSHASAPIRAPSLGLRDRRSSEVAGSGFPTLPGQRPDDGSDHDNDAGREQDGSPGARAPAVKAGSGGAFVDRTRALLLDDARAFSDARSEDGGPGKPGIPLARPTPRDTVGGRPPPLLRRSPPFGSTQPQRSRACTADGHAQDHQHDVDPPPPPQHHAASYHALIWQLAGAGSRSG